jgi:hypothetical protein
MYNNYVKIHFLIISKTLHRFHNYNSLLLKSLYSFNFPYVLKYRMISNKR